MLLLRTFLFALTALHPLINPIGSALVFVGLVGDAPPATYLRLAKKVALVRVLAVGVDGTDKEIVSGEYGSPPPGEDHLITGHENFGVVERVGSLVKRVQVGDHVVATVRRPGSSIFDEIGRPDFTTDDVYFERGINLRHGFLTEHYVEEAGEVDGRLVGCPGAVHNSHASQSAPTGV